MSETETNEIGAGDTRRNLLKKAAVAGAVVWTAPTILSSPAFAATAQCDGSMPCTTWYFRKSDETNCVAGDSSAGCNGIIPTDVFCIGGPQFFTPAPCGGSLTNNSYAFPAGSVPLHIQIKAATDCFTYTYSGSAWTTQDIAPGCYSITGYTSGTITKIGSGPNCQGISHTNMMWCQ